MKNTLFSITLSLTLASVQGQQSEVLFDNFDSPNYTVSGSTSTGNPDDISSVQVSNETAGGNPGGYSAVTHNIDVARDGSGAPQSGDGKVLFSSIFLENGSPYDAATNGVIRTIQFSFDLRSADRGRYSFAINSDSSTDFTPEAELNQSKGWTTYQSPVYSQSDFGGVNFSTNNPLNFGFRLTTDADVTAGPEVFGYDVDNFRVSVTTVPEPSGMILLALGALGAVSRRQR